MQTKLIAVLISSAFIGTPVFAADLMQVYKEALANDAQYGSARASLEAGKETLVQARSALLPSVGLSGNYGNSYAQGQSVSAYAATLSASQPLYRPGNWEQYAQGELAVAANEAQFAQAQQDLILRVAQAYFDVLASQDALASVNAQKNATTEQLASAKRNFEVGTQTITDTHEAQARYDLIVAQEFAAQSDLEIKRTALQQIIGKESTDLAPLRAGITISPPQPAQMDAWVQAAEKQNYSVIGAEIGLNIAKRQIKLNRTGHMPTLDLVASKARTNAPGASPNTTQIGLQWNIPIFNGFAIDSKVRQAISQENKARFDLESSKRGASQAARQAFLAVNSGLAQVKALEAADVSSNSALSSNKLGYQVGVRINIDVLNAQQQVFSNRRDLSKARYDTLLNGLRLKSAAGSLKESDIEEINALLQK